MMPIKFDEEIALSETCVWFPFAGAVADEKSVWHVLVSCGRVALVTNPNVQLAAFVYLQDQNLDTFRIDEPFNRWCSFDRPSNESEASVFCSIVSYMLGTSLDWETVWPAIATAKKVCDALNVNFRSVMFMAAEGDLFEST